MFKNILAKGIAVSLAVLFFLTSFGAGTKSANAAAALPILVLTLLGGSIASHVGLEINAGSFSGMHDTLPLNTFKGPHFIPDKETY